MEAVKEGCSQESNAREHFEKSDNPLKKIHLDLYKTAISPEKMIQIYNQRSFTYDKEYADLDGEYAYRGHSIIADEVAERYKTDRALVKILDIGSGTGQVGQQLYDRGFRLIDGVDASQGMLDCCNEKNIYKHLFCEYVSDRALPIEKGSYDVVVMSGTFSRSHLPVESLKELTRIVKQGGHFCSIMREQFVHTADEFNNGKLDGFMDKLEQVGVWEKVFRRVVPNYLVKNNGLFHVYRIP